MDSTEEPKIKGCAFMQEVSTFILAQGREVVGTAHRCEQGLPLDALAT